MFSIQQNRRGRKFLATLLWLPLGTAVLVAAPVPGPIIRYTAPLGLSTGKTTLLTLSGTNLESCASLWTSFPAKTKKAAVPSAGGHAAFEVTVPKTVAPGIGAFRLIGSNGVSSLHLLWIGQAPSSRLNSSNNTMESAHLIEMPTAIEGTVPRLGFSYYQVRANVGEEIRAEVIGQRVGSKIDPVLRLLDRRGRELKYSDDAPGIAPDCRFNYRAPSNALYFLEVRDLEYGGGPEYGYRLEIGRFPERYLTFPLVAQSGTRAKLLPLTERSHPVSPFFFAMPNTGETITLPIPSRNLGQGSGFATVSASPLPQAMEIEPNHQRGESAGLSLPCGVNGRFDKAGDRDYYRFEAKKDERWAVRALTRELGSPCDLYIQLESSSGASLTNLNGGSLSETNLVYTFTEDGSYYLRVEELAGQGGAGYPYYLEIKPFRPGFSLQAEIESANAEPGGSVEIKLVSTRFGYNGRIKLFAEGLSQEFLLDNDVIPEGKNEVQLKVSLPFRARPGELYRFSLAGRGQVNKEDYYTIASTAPALRRLLGQNVYSLRELDRVITLGIATPKP